MKNVALFIMVVSSLCLQAKQWTAEEVKDIIRRVNTYWQKNNPANMPDTWAGNKP